MSSHKQRMDKNLLGAHCTGIEPVFGLRQRLGMDGSKRRAPWARGSTSRRGSNQAGSHSRNRNVPTRPEDEDRGAIRPIRAVLPPTLRTGLAGSVSMPVTVEPVTFRIRPTRLIECRLKSPLLPGKMDERYCILEVGFRIPGLNSLNLLAAGKKSHGRDAVSSLSRSVPTARSA